MLGVSWGNRIPGGDELTYDGPDFKPALDTQTAGPVLGAISGHVAVGRYILEIGEPCGARVRETSPGGGAGTRSRPAPVLLRPPALRGLVGRQAELTTALAALDDGLPIEVCGEAGVGKTAFLRHLAHLPDSALFADGIVFLSARHQPCADLVQLIFEAFYEIDGIRKPTDAQMRRDLRDKRALILLDDVRLPQEELDRVFEVAARSVFVVATRERRLWDEGVHLTLGGLNADDAVLLLERAVERPIDDGERPAAIRLCESLGGHPLRILQASAIAREKGIALDSWPVGITPDSLVTELMKSVDERQRRALLAMTALPGVPLSVQHVSSIAEVTDLEPAIQALLRLGLVVRSHARFQAATGVADRLRRREDLNPWVHRVITYFTAWTARYQRDANVLLEESEAILRAQQYAAESRRSGEVLRLGRFLEGALIVGGRWGAWANVLERCLAAAKATGDRAAEAWALHQLGTRAVCLGDERVARSLLGEAVSLREALGDAAAAVSRQNLGFVVASVSVSKPVQERPALPFGIDFDALAPRGPAPPFTGGRRPGNLAVAAMLLLLAGVGWFAGMAVDAVRSYAPASRSSVSSPSPPPRAVTAPLATTGDASAAPRPVLETTADVPVVESSNIRIFTARPGSIGATRSTEICYAVSNASQARIDPGIGDVDPTNTLTCRRVAPARTTTYRLTAYGRDGNRHSQSVVVVVR
jgi:hypothetical protein